MWILGHEGLKKLRRGLANPPLVLRAKDFTFQGRIRGILWQITSVTETTTCSQSVYAGCRHWRGKYRLLCEQRLS